MILTVDEALNNTAKVRKTSIFIEAKHNSFAYTLNSRFGLKADIFIIIDIVLNIAISRFGLYSLAAVNLALMIFL